MLTDELKSQILSHAEECYPNESCGVIVNGEYVKCKNESDTPLSSFKISNLDKDRAEDNGPIQAYVHSHPDATSTPSDFDLLSIEKHNKPWVICSLPDISFSVNNPNGYKAPLIGRKFYHGWQDCYTLIQDFYKREFGKDLPNFERQDRWWESDKGPSLYVDNFKEAGFVPVETFKYGDVLVFSIRSNHPNHAAIFLESKWELLSEDSEKMIGNMLFLHHMYGRLSCREMLSNYWIDRMSLILRHKDFL